VLQTLTLNQHYWLAQMTATDLGTDAGELRCPQGPPTARTFDVFGTANFFNLKPWAASIEYLLGIGVERIAPYDQHLVECFLAGLDPTRYRLSTPARA
jgi:hypothetical protein